MRGTSNLYSAVATHCIQSLYVPSIARPSLCFATQLQVMPSLHTEVEAFTVLYAATQRHCYALQHHAVAVQCLSSPFGAMPLPRDTMRFIAYPLLFEAFRSYSFALVAYLSLRCESCCLAAPLLCHSEPRTATPFPVIAIAFRCHSALCPCFAVPITAIPGPAIALNRALRM